MAEVAELGEAVAVGAEAALDPALGPLAERHDGAVERLRQFGRRKVAGEDPCAERGEMAGDVPAEAVTGTGDRHRHGVEADLHAVGAPAEE